MILPARAAWPVAPVFPAEHRRARLSFWDVLLDDRRALRLKWAVLVLLLLATALLDAPL